MEDPVIRLPKYARGLQLVRVGVLLMLGQLVLSIVAIAKALTAGTDPNSAIEWMKYTMWANLAATGAMLLGALFAIPDFARTKVPLRPLITATIGFGITLATLLWTYFALIDFLDLMQHPFAHSLDDLVEATERLARMDWIAVVKDIAYTVGLLAIVRSIKETARANEHDALEATADYVGRLLGIMLAVDVTYQIIHRLASGVLSLMAIFVLVAAIGIFVYWIYCHYKLQKFLRAAAILVNEPHHLPTARVVSTSDTAPAVAPVVPRPSAPRVGAPTGPQPAIPRAATGPAADASGPTSMPSQPVIVAAEIRSAPAPRAETAPGSTEEPKFLR